MENANEINNESWIIEIGDEIVSRKAKVGIEGLSDVEKLIYSFWVLDYSIRNSGELAAGSDIYNDFIKTGSNIARGLSLANAEEIFNINDAEPEREFYELFDKACEELQKLT